LYLSIRRAIKLIAAVIEAKYFCQLHREIYPKSFKITPLYHGNYSGYSITINVWLNDGIY